MFAIYPILIVCVIPEQWRSSFWTLAIHFFLLLLPGRPIPGDICELLVAAGRASG